MRHYNRSLNNCFLFLAWGIVSFCYQPATAQNLVLNGSFETPVTDNMWGQHPGSWFAGEEFGHWHVFQGSIDIKRFSGNPEGEQRIDLNGTPGVGGIYQDVTVDRPGEHRLSFFLSANTNVNPNLPRRMRVSLTEGENILFLQELTWLLSEHPGHEFVFAPLWDYYTFTIDLPQPGTYRLAFTSLTTDNELSGPYLDHVVLEYMFSGDVNGDGCVNDLDLLAVLFAFGESGSDLAEDLNGDGSVNDEDLLIVLFRFGTGC
ncbi:MAG: hypothetical protein KIT45_14230 [Fimbriimonadia bacterium]|nr:hypothetical protein [Fimbriimonadia bacterium]